MKNIYFIFFILTLSLYGEQYNLINEPIDVVIPAIEKDLPTLEHCIQGIKQNCKQVRRVIVVSKNQLSTQAEWFDEANFPFSKFNVAVALCKGSVPKAKKYMKHIQSRAGWYFQQLLKLYAPTVIPGLSSNVLILDSDTIFLNPVEFVKEDGGGLYCLGTEYHKPYFVHGAKLIPGFSRLDPSQSGVCHHMLFQRAILDDLFNVVETRHQRPLWRVFCELVDKEMIYLPAASEYELYFNFAFARTDQIEVRPLKWTNTPYLSRKEKYRDHKFHFISCHSTVARK